MVFLRKPSRRPFTSAFKVEINFKWYDNNLHSLHLDTSAINDGYTSYFFSLFSYINHKAFLLVEMHVETIVIPFENSIYNLTRK